MRSTCLRSVALWARGALPGCGLALNLLGCSCDEEPAAPRPVASVAASAATSEVRRAQPVSFSAEDGVPLAGELLLGSAPDDPLVVLVHRFHGDRSEWRPLFERLSAASSPLRVVSVDLRGHGESTRDAEGGLLGSGALPREQIPTLKRDVAAAIQLGLRGVSPRFVVLVGSSLGATLAAQAAADAPEVRALALISPGALLEGQDIYTAYAAVRQLPTWFAVGRGDNVSRAPIGSLVQMSKQHELKEYESPSHSAARLGESAPALWDDLTQWLLSVASGASAVSAPDGGLEAGAATGGGSASGDGAGDAASPALLGDAATASPPEAE